MTLKERYELLAQEYDAASEYAHRTRQEMEESYGVWMEVVISKMEITTQGEA